MLRELASPSTPRSAASLPTATGLQVVQNEYGCEHRQQAFCPNQGTAGIGSLSEFAIPNSSSLRRRSLSAVLLSKAALTHREEMKKQLWLPTNLCRLRLARTVKEGLIKLQRNPPAAKAAVILRYLRTA
jgi:hypothetical protein